MPQISFPVSHAPRTSTADNRSKFSNNQALYCGPLPLTHTVSSKGNDVVTSSEEYTVYRSNFCVVQTLSTKFKVNGNFDCVNCGRTK